MENNLPFKSSPPPPLFQKYPFTQELGLPVLQQQFDYSVHQLSLGNGKRAGACFTEVIKTINSNVLASTYLHRSAAFAMQGKQGPAVQDIYKAIHLSPAQPDGYIYAYNVFVSFKRYREAFLALTEGLKQVNKADRKYAALGFMKDSLLAEIDNKNSLPLPYDVITSILRRLSFRDRIHLASTCKYWERMLHESPPIMWHDIDIRSPMGVGQFQRLLSHVDSFYVRRVKADTHEMLNEINNVEWRHIECLDLESVYQSDLKLRPVLLRNKRKLKEFSLISTFTTMDHSARYLHDILSWCSNLTHLTIHAKGYKEQDLVPFVELAEAQVVAQDPQVLTAAPHERQQSGQLNNIIAPPKLISSNLIYLSVTEVRQLPFILPYCSDLRYLEILEQHLLPGHPPSIFSIIDEWCPHLIRFRYSSLSMISRSRFYPGNDLTERSLFKNYNVNDTAAILSLRKKGLRELIYAPLDVVDVGVSTTIQKNIHTLQHLRLNTTLISYQGFELQRALSSSPNNSLREIEIHGRRAVSFNVLKPLEPYPHFRQIHDIIRACPSLMSVSIHDILMHDDDIFFALGDLRKLRRVALIRAPLEQIQCRHKKSVFQCGLRYLFTNTKTLQEFYVNGISRGDPVRNYFDAMTYHKGLRSIHFKGAHDIYLDNTHVIAHILTELTDLTIESWGDIMLPPINYLHLLPKLESLTLNGATVFNMSEQVAHTLFQKRRDLFMMMDAPAPPVLKVSVYHGMTQKEEKYFSCSDEEFDHVMCQKRGGGQQKKRIVQAQKNVYATTYYQDSRTLFENEVQRVIEAMPSSYLATLGSDGTRRRQ